IGMILGLRTDMTKYGRFTPYLSGDINFSNVSTNRISTFSYSSTAVESSKVELNNTSDIFISLNGTVGLKYRFLPRISLEAGLMATKPLRNYSHELNPYNSDKDYLLGSRFG